MGCLGKTNDIVCVSDLSKAANNKLTGIYITTMRKVGSAPVTFSSGDVPTCDGLAAFVVLSCRSLTRTIVFAFAFAFVFSFAHNFCELGKLLQSFASEWLVGENDR